MNKNEIENNYDKFIKSFIKTNPLQKSLRLAREIMLELAKQIKKQWLECNQEETEEDFYDEDYEDLQHAVIVLENYIH